MRSLIIILLLSGLSLVSCHSGKSRETLKSGPPDPAPTENDTLATGREVYRQTCLTCHQEDGSGVPMMYPALQESDWISGDKDKLIGLLIQGMSGPIEVNGESYAGIMPPSKLNDEQIADVLTYIRNSFGNSASAVSPEEVTRVRTRLGSEEVQ